MMRTLVLMLVGHLVMSVAVSAEESGETIYQEHCAACHDAETTKAPALSSLKAMTSETLTHSLTEGKMKAEGNALSDVEKASLIAWLTQGQVSPVSWEETAMCTDPRVRLKTRRAANVTSVGYDLKSHRYQKTTSIRRSNVAKLTLDKVIAFPGETEMRAQPALVGDTLFVAVAAAQKLYAFDAEEMCLKWVFEAPDIMRSGVVYGEVEGQSLLFLSAGRAVHAIDAETGKGLWRKESHFFSLHTAAPVLHEGVLYVAESSWEMFAALDDKYECCRVSGTVKAFDALTGKLHWATNTTPVATKQEPNEIGTGTWGPSGAPVWSTPTLDVKRGLIYVGTGENYSRPTTETSDAILALDMETGAIKWSFQGTPDDAYNAACLAWMGMPDKPGCPDNPGDDLDFGASVMLVDAGPRDLLLAGQKSGMVYALEPETGALAWKTRLSDGNLMGGIHWNMSYVGGTAYIGIADPNIPFPNYTPRPGLVALDVKTGQVLWKKKVEASCAFDPAAFGAAKAKGERITCPPHFGFSGGITSSSGLVYTAGIDGIIRAHDARDGEILWQAETAKPFTSTNGPKAHGGALDNNTLVVGRSQIYVSSGYGQFMDQVPGNVLLVYKLAGR